MRRNYIVGLIIVLLIALIGFKLYSNKKKLDEKKQPAAVTVVKIPVKVDTVSNQLLQAGIVKTGSVSPFGSTQVFTTVGGTVQGLHFDLGDKVSRGQLLAVMDRRLSQLDLQRAEINEAKLKKDLQTYSELLAGKAATEERVNEIRQNYTDAVNQSAQIRKQIGDAQIKAPIGGTIAVRSVEQGVYIPAGTAIATIVDLSRVKVQVYLTETEVYQVKPGQLVKITTDVYPDQLFSGKVSFISPEANAVHNYLVEVLMDNNGRSFLRSGTFVYADFSQKTQQHTLIIPREALTESVQDAAVYVVENNRALLRNIRVGKEMNGGMEVLAGLKAGELVVVSGQINLKQGTEVLVAN